MVLYVITPTLLAGKAWLRLFSAKLSLSTCMLSLGYWFINLIISVADAEKETQD